MIRKDLRPSTSEETSQMLACIGRAKAKVSDRIKFQARHFGFKSIKPATLYKIPFKSVPNSTCMTHFYALLCILNVKRP